MEELLQSLHRFREKLKVYGDWLAETGLEIPNCFNMIFNDLTLTLELLSYYYEIWKKPPPVWLSADEIEEIRRENAERVMEITKWTAFIHALSCMEFTAKETLRVMNIDCFKGIGKRLLRGRDYVHLITIMKRSKESKLIDEEHYGTWEGLIDIRNAIVHNNAIADRDTEYNIDGMKVVFIKGNMLKGKLDLFIRLTEIAVDRYRQWLQTLISIKTSGSS